MDLEYAEVSSHYMGLYSTISGRFSNDHWEFNLPRESGLGLPEQIANISFKNIGTYDFFSASGDQEVLEKWLNFFKNQCENKGISLIEPRLKKRQTKNEIKEREGFQQAILASKILRSIQSAFTTDLSTFHDPIQQERMYIDPNSLGETPFKNPLPDERDFNQNGVILQRHAASFKELELALTCYLVALKKNPSFEPALTNKNNILKILGWEDGDVFELFKKNILIKLDSKTAKTLESLSEKINLGIQLEKEIEPLDDSTFNRKLSIMIRDNTVIGLGIFNCTEVIPDIIGNFSTLEYLYLHGGRRLSLKYVPETIKNLVALKKLSIHKLKEEYLPEWLNNFKKKMKKKIEFNITIEQVPKTSRKNGKKLEKRDLVLKRKKTQKESSKFKKDIEKRKIKQEEIEIEKEKELIKQLKDVEKLIEAKDFQKAEDNLDNIIHNAKRYHLNIIENKAKEEYNKYKNLWQHKEDE